MLSDASSSRGRSPHRRPMLRFQYLRRSSCLAHDPADGSRHYEGAAVSGHQGFERTQGWVSLESRIRTAMACSRWRSAMNRGSAFRRRAASLEKLGGEEYRSSAAQSGAHIRDTVQALRGLGHKPGRRAICTVVGPHSGPYGSPDAGGTFAKLLNRGRCGSCLTASYNTGHPWPVSIRRRSGRNQNCSSSVDPCSAVTEEWPPWMTVVMSSK